MVRIAPALPLALRYGCAAHKALRSASTPGQAASARRFLKTLPQPKICLPQVSAKNRPSAFSRITLSVQTQARVQTDAPAVAGFLPAGRAVTRFGRHFQSTREPLPLLNHQTPIPPPLRGLISPKTFLTRCPKLCLAPSAKTAAGPRQRFGF